MGFSTDAIHAGQVHDPTTGSVTTPIYQTSTYSQQGIGDHKGFEYARTHNLTREALEKNLAVLEKGKHGICFASGMAAIHALMQSLKEGDHVLLGDNLYGGTYRLLDRILRPLGTAFDTVATQDPDAVEAGIRPQTRMVLMESPTNPVMTLTDIPRLAELCRARDVTLAVKRAFLSVTEAERRMQVAGESLALAEEERRLVEERYRLGASFLLELIDSQVAYTTAQTNHISALYDYQLALAQLEQAVGVAITP